MTCLFCKIIERKIPADIIFEDDTLFAFRDINPQAPEHILIIPKKHINTINDADDNDAQLLGEITLCAKNIAKNLGVDNDGYRLVFNINNNGGQEVYHIHLHLLAGRQMCWPPG